MDSIHRRIGTPVVTDVRLEPAASGLEVVADALVPDRPPCLFAGSPLLLLGPLPRAGRMGRWRCWARPRRPSVARGGRSQRPRQSGDRLGMGARQVRQLEDRYAAGLGDRSALEQTIIATSLRFGVLCRFTAYVAVDRCGGRQRGGRGAPDHAAGGDAGGVGCANVVMSARAAGGLPMKWVLGASMHHPRICEPDMLDSCEAIADLSMPRASASPPSASRRDLRAEKAPPSPAPPTPPTPEDPFQKAGLSLSEKIGEDGLGRSYRGQDRAGERS